MKAQAPKYFNKKFGLGMLFLPLAGLYWFAGKMAKLFSVGYRAKATVVCVGNVVVGGVGKTPLVIEVVEHFLKLGKRVAVISRGYGSDSEKGETPVFVDVKKSTADEVGDEPLMIAKRFRGKVPVCICRNRGVGLQCLDAMGVDVVVADDGLQNYTFKKDKVVIVFDGKDCIGNGWILPAGPLRETLTSGMKKADIVMMMRQANPTFEKRLWRYGKPVFHAKTVVQNTAEFAGKKVVAFAGIGKPEKFYKSLSEAGANIVGTYDFDDHHHYVETEILHLVDMAKKHKAMLVTTEKDFVKLPTRLADKISVLRIGVEIDNPDEFFDGLK